MGVNFTPKAPKPTPAKQIAALEAQVTALKEQLATAKSSNTAQDN